MVFINSKCATSIYSLLGIIENMAAQLANDLCCTKRYLGVYDLNSNVNLCPCKRLNSRKSDHC